MILVFLTTFAVRVMEALGLPGVFALMAAESMILPVPSEAVMPFAGYLVARGVYGFWAAALVSVVGTLCGSLLSYWIGRYGGRPFLRRFGRWFLIDEGHLDWTERWFARQGSWTIFIARFIPVVRHLISIPAGAARMPYIPFLLMTAIGGGIWNTFLLWVGVRIGARWELVHAYSTKADLVLVILLVLAVVAWYWHQRRYRKSLSKLQNL